MSEFNENEVFPESDNIPEPEIPPEYVTADIDLPEDVPKSDAAEAPDSSGEASGADISDSAAAAENVTESASASPQPGADTHQPNNPISFSPVPGSVPYHNYYQNQYNGYQYSAPITTPAPSKSKNKGIVILAIVLSAVLVLCFACCGLYVVFSRINNNGTSGDAGGSGPAINTDLVDRPDTDDEDSASYVYGQTVDSVVLIQVYSYVDNTVGSEASGVIYSKDGYIVTNDHIYADIPDPKFLVTTADGRQFDAEFIAGDKRTDLAVLKVKADGLKPASFVDSEQCVVGEDVITVGNPGGSAFTFSMTEGIISATDRWASNSSNYSMRFIQTTAPINSGNSGGGLFNMYGQVVGITTWKYVGDNFENMGFAVPSSTVVRICDSLIANGYVADRAKLGFKYRAIDAVTAKVNNIDSTGLLVSEITGDTSFAKSGAAEGDLITHINGTQITDSVVVLALLEELHPGDTVTLSFLRSNGTRFDADVELVEDRGTSSFTLESSGNNSSMYSYGGDFNFPNGD